MRVSVIIRNRNEAEHLKKVLLALSVQTIPHEIILVDNRSTDDSVRIAESFGAKIVHLEQFTYGRGLNVGLAQATGEICVILSAHALPLGKKFIEGCVEPFSDPRVAAARCVYVGKGSDAMRWTAPETLTRATEFNEIIAKGPLASGCAIRRSVWEKIPFNETVIAAEDKLWARDVLRGGYIIVSPCDAFYRYIKPFLPHVGLRYADRDSRAVFAATGVRVGASNISVGRTILGSIWSALTEAPRAALLVLKREATKVWLRLRFPRHQKT